MCINDANIQNLSTYFQADNVKTQNVLYGNKATFY